MMDFGAWVKHQLKKKNMTQTELALRADIDPTKISRYTRGEIDLRLSTMLRIVHALGKRIVFEDDPNAG